MGLFWALHIVILGDLYFFRCVFAGFFQVKRVREIDNSVIFWVHEQYLSVNLLDTLLDFYGKWVEICLFGKVLFQVTEQRLEKQLGDEGFFWSYL